MTAASSDPVVTVTRTIADGTCVRWFTDLDACVNQKVSLTAGRYGVTVGHGIYLTDIPAAWVQAATQAHKTLAANRDADMTGLATHRHRFGDRGGPIEPVTEATS